MTWKQEVPIIEKNARESLDAVLEQIRLSNDVCSALVAHEFKGLGTPAPVVVLEWDDDHCSET